MLLRKIKITKNPFLFFLPILFLYVIFIFIISNNVLWGDEHIYVGYANNLSHGFYSSPEPQVSLNAGPGYPLFILPFIALELPLITVRLLNAVLIYFSVILLFRVLIKFVSFKKALLFSLFWAGYYNYLDFIALICSETLAIFLMSALVFLLVKAFDSDIRIKTKKYVYLSGFILGCLVLTKIIFGYVLLCMMTGSVFLWIMNRKAINYQKAIIILLIAFTTVVPYLIYTYHLTGKIYYFGTSGGNNLYWMSTPYEGEYGSWFPSPNLESDSIAFKKIIPTIEKGGLLNLKNEAAYIPGYEDSLKSNHRKDFEEVLSLKGEVERDDAYRKIAIDNIKTYPVKYIVNCFSNIGRILFNYPYCYTLQKPGTLIRFPLNGIIVVLMLYCIIPTIINWKKISFPIRFLLFFAFVYLGGSIFGSAEFRMFTVIVPVLVFWIAFIIQKSIKLNIAKWEDGTPS